MGQIALPLTVRRADDPVRIVVGNANRAAIDALSDPGNWPYGTAILAGPARSGKSLLSWWAEAQHGNLEAIDGADATRLGAMGFCFGGLCVLDAARHGIANLRGVAAFHALFTPPPLNT